MDSVRQKQLGKNSYPQLVVREWIDRVNAERMSVAKMKREANRAFRPTEPPPLGSMFNEQATDKARSVFRLDAIRIVVAELDEQECARLRGELEELIAALGLG